MAMILDNVKSCDSVVVCIEIDNPFFLIAQRNRAKEHWQFTMFDKAFANNAFGFFSRIEIHRHTQPPADVLLR